MEFTADDTRRRRRRNEILQPVDRTSSRRVTVHRKRKTVEEGILAVLDARFQQVNDGFFARILQFFQTRNSNGKSRLTDREFSRSESLTRRNIQNLITAVPLKGTIVSVC